MVLGLSTNDVKVKIASEQGCVQTLSVEMPTSAVQETIEKAFEQVRARVKVPGFRPGKAPIEMVKQNYQEAAFEQAQELLLREGVSEALKQKKLHAVETPVVTKADFNPTKSFHFEFQVEVAPSFKVSGHKGLKITKTVKPVSDADLDKALESVAGMNARLAESKDDTVAKTHYVVMNYEGFLDGKAIEGGKAENFLMDMSAPQAISGLAEGLLGAKVGEEKDVTVTFPADSPSKELAGKQAVFKVKVIALKEKVTPKLDDEFAKDLGFDSFDVLKTKVRESLQKERDEASRAEVERQITDGLLAENDFPVPPSMVKRQTEYLLKRQRERMTSQGMPEAEADKALEGMKAEAQKQAEKEVRLAYVLNSVAESENISATDAEINAKIASIVERSQPQERESLEKALRGGYRDRIESEVRDSKLMSWLIDHAKVKEVREGKS
jgi:trigger factor